MVRESFYRLAGPAVSRIVRSLGIARALLVHLGRRVPKVCRDRRDRPGPRVKWDRRALWDRPERSGRLEMLERQVRRVRLEKWVRKDRKERPGRPEQLVRRD